MKKHLSTIVTVLVLAIAVVSQFRISNLQSEMQRMENRFNSSISTMQSNQSAAINHMQSLMEKEASILTYTDFSLGEMDLTNKTFVLKGNVTPKEHQPRVTEAFLTVNGNAYPMALANGTYTVQVDLPLFEEARVDKVEFHEGDVIRTETLDEQWSPRYRFLPQVSGRLSGSGRGSAANGVYTWHREGEARINVEGKGPIVDVRSVALVEMLDGVEVARTEIPLTSTERNRKKQCNSRTSSSHIRHTGKWNRDLLSFDRPGFQNPLWQHPRTAGRGGGWQRSALSHCPGTLDRERKWSECRRWYVGVA